MQKAKIFVTGGSQAVRLPAEFRFEGREVGIHRDPSTGNVILSVAETWDDYFAWAQQQDWPADFMRDRQQSIDSLRDPFEGITGRKGRARG
jgi:antitoxin VapB